MGDFVDADGVHTFFDVLGGTVGASSTSPILFLHGGFASGADYVDLRERLAARRVVITPDRRGHGRTPEVEGPLGYAVMATDTIAFLDAIGVRRAHLVGHSDGAILALLIAIAHPERVDRIVPISANSSPAAMEPATASAFADMPHDDLVAEVANWAQREPDWPPRSPEFVEQVRRMFLSEPNITADDLARISAPTLIVGADHDAMVLEDIIFQFRYIPNAQLAIVPGATHALTAERPDLVARLVLDFLDGS